MEQSANINNKNISTILGHGDNERDIKTACDILKNGGLVAFPTETVYGLGANALDKEAAARIYEAKGRPSDNPLIVHIANTQSVHELAEEVPEQACMLMEAFWPGPLTIILPKKSSVPDGTTGGLPTVAIRMPSHPTALSLINKSGVYIAAPSANTSGRPSPTTAEHVIEDMNGKIDMIIDGGAVGIGIESTIVDLTGSVPTILRPGYITKTMLEQIVGHVETDKALIEPDPDIRPKAPGMKYTHYSPKGELTIVEASGTDSDYNAYSLSEAYNIKIADKINSLTAMRQSQGFRTAVLASSENAHLYKCENILIAGQHSDGETIASKLYALLRQCDALDIDYIYSEAFDQGELGGAIMNRLLKAAGQRVILV